MIALLFLRHASLTSLLVFTLYCNQLLAWGKQGHAIVNQTAALLLADSRDYDFLREHSFDLAYFSNVPDIIWKKEKTYDLESPQHFMDMEIFERGLKFRENLNSKIPIKINDAFLLDREEFDTKYANIPLSAGRSWWRIREVYDLFHKQTLFLADSKMSVKERHELQAQWLVLAGVLGHYIGDLAQPLHCTENYNGQLSSQKGIHAYFEDKIVNLLLPKLENEVLIAAKVLWPNFSKESHDLSTLSLVAELTRNSRLQLKSILEKDKKIGRKNPGEKAKQFDKLIVRQLAEAAVTLAELWRRNLDWKPNSHSFYTFHSTPDYINPGTSRSTHIEEFKGKK